MVRQANQLGQRLLVNGLIGLLILFGGGASRAAAQSGPAYELIAAVNQFRAQHGLPALQPDPSLMAAAQRHAEWSAANAHYSHTGEGGSSPQSRATAAGYAGTVYENFEGGSDLTAQGAVYWWQQDSVHLNTMLLPRHVHIGVGYAANKDQRLFVLMVGLPSKRAPAPSKASPSPPVTPTDAPIPVAPIVISTPGADGSIMHVVGQGQTAWAIAARYGIVLDELLALNNLTRGAILHPGDSIIIRLGQGQSPPASPTLQVVHVVQPGETIWSIAARYGVDLDDLLTLNGLTRGAILHPGDRIVLHPSAPTAAPATPQAAITTLTAFIAVGIAPTLTVQPSPTLTPTFVRTVLSPTPASNADSQSPGQSTLIAIVLGGIGLAILASGALALRRRRS